MVDVENILEQLSIKYVVDTECTNIYKVPNRDIVTVVQNNNAFNAYDREHPERIDSILLYKSTFIVIVKDRDIDHTRYVKYWIDNNSLSDIKDIQCTVCYEKIKKKLPMKRCAYCNTWVCLRCDHKMKPENPDATQCVVCRQWNLCGNSFGQPYAMITNEFKEANSLTSQQFADLLYSLDGAVMLIPRVGYEILMHNALRYCKLAYTDRYNGGSIQKINIKRFVKKWAKTNNYIYIVRSTYKIHKEFNKPITELTAFLYEDGYKQLSSNAYMNFCMLDQAYIDVIEYIRPYKFELPTLFHNILDTIVNSYKNTHMTISLSTIQFDSGNFDVAENGNISTMHPDLLAVFVNKMFRNDVVYLACRVHSNERIYLAGEIKPFDDSYVLYTEKEARRFFNRNLDKLKNSVFIHKFVGRV